MGFRGNQRGGSLGEDVRASANHPPGLLGTEWADTASADLLGGVRCRWGDGQAPCRPLPPCGSRSTCSTAAITSASLGPGLHRPRMCKKLMDYPSPSVLQQKPQQQKSVQNFHSSREYYEVQESQTHRVRKGKEGALTVFCSLLLLQKQH